MHRSLLLALAAFLLVAPPGSGQQAPRLNKEKLAPEMARRMQEFVDRNVISGVVALVARGDDFVATTVGARNFRSGIWDKSGKFEPTSGSTMNERDLFWIASMTKPMTAVCVAMLVDEGKLAFDDPVEKHLPEFKEQWLLKEDGKEQRVLARPARAITIRDLLTHTSGLGDVPAPRAYSTLAELCMGYAREPLMFPPGSKWSYSNQGINTLGRLVEVASGVPFAEFIQRRLFDPLGMRDTTFWPSAEQVPRIAKSYESGKDGKLQEIDVYFIKGALSDRSRTPFPAGGLYSTAGDVAALYRMMLAGGIAPDGRTLLQKGTVAEMTRTQTGDIKTGFTDGMSWGLGVQVVKEPQGVTAMLAPGTFGHGGAYGTQSWADPKNRTIYVLMIQRAKMAGGDAHEVRKAMQEAVAATLE